MATMMEIGIEMKRLTDAMPAPRGVDPRKAYAAYEVALKDFPSEAVTETIDRYLSGAFPKISLKFYPRAPELAACVRVVIAERGAAEQEAKRQAALAADRREVDEGEAMRKARTPEDKARVAAKYAEFLQGHRAAKLDDIKARKLPMPADVLAERAAIRAQYGMTDEAVSAIKSSKPPPAPMQQVGDVVPGIPVPQSQAEQDAEELR